MTFVEDGEKYTEEATYSISGNTLTLTWYEEDLDEVETMIMKKATE